ncbi:RNA-directed DNA polymerase, eukaryota, partial [Tanacetum coccineum]
MWGNLSFDYAWSSSIGNSGGILYVWDSRFFVKDNVTASDNFLAIRGVWVPTSTRLLIISVYAPQDLSEKGVLWDYLCHLMDMWYGECVMLGDFNEVRSEPERFGSLFNTQGAKVFNNFISLSEGDENSKFFHGFINNKRAQLAIRGVLIDAEWLVDLRKVKNEFLKHFANCFSKPDDFRIKLDFQPPKMLSLDQDFLDDVLKSFGFGNKWRGWINGCLNSAMGSILVNGCPTSEFQFHKGLKINIHKSKLMGVGVASDEVESVARIVGCSTFSSPFTYLGVKMGGFMSRIKSWDEVKCNLTSRLCKWKIKTLSIGVRLTLLKYVLSSMPLYHMFIFKVPMGVLKNMESMRRNFFNGVEGSNGKMALICWEKVLASKK